MVDSWKFYAQRAVSGEWLDTDVQLADLSLTYGLSTINSGQLLLPTPGIEPFGSDGRPVWGKWDTLFYAERNGALDWVGLADMVSPGATGTQVKLVGLSAWLSRVDFSGIYQVWQTNTFDVLRMLLDHANGKPRGLTFAYPGALMSATTVGDPEPPPKPVKPPRNKHEKKADYQASARYTTWQADLTTWTNTYGNYEKYKILFWESPYVGDEFNSLSSELGFDWRESYRWVSALNPEFKINFADDLSAVRTDVIIEEGVNIQGRLTPSDDDETYANKVLAVGAGQGRNTRKESASYDDGRLYATRFLIRKHIHNKHKLQNQATRAVNHYRRIDPQIGTVNVNDSDGTAAALKPGDIVRVKSRFLVPNIDAMAQIVSKTEYPLQPGTVQFEFQTQAS